MSVDAFTVDGVINVDTTPFESGLTKVTSQLSKLGTSMNEIMEMGGGNWNFNGALNGLKTLQDDIAVIQEDIATMNSEFANVQGINALKSEITTLRTEMDAIKEKINQMGSVAKENVTKVGNAIESAKQKTLGWSEQIAKVTEGIVSLMTKEEFSNYILEQQESEVGQINAQWREMQGLIQSNTTFMREIEASGSNIARYFTHETQILERNVALLEQEAELTSMLNQRSRQNATTVSNIAKELNRVANFSREVGTYFANEDKILRMSLRTIQEQDRILADKLAKSERETALAKEIADINKMDMDLRKATGSALSEIVDLTGLEADNILKVANGEKEVLSFIEKQVSAEKERLDLMMAITEMESAQISKVPVTGGKGATGGKNQLDKMGYLPSRIGSMAVTMWGFNEIMDIYEKSMANINAQGQMKTYTDLMKKDNRYLTQTKQNVNDVTTGLNDLNKSLYQTYKGGDSLQKMYQKVDMTQVGANAMDTAFKYGVQAENLDDLTEVMAIYGSEFVRQGRSQEDSILAVNDALDGELRRLKEVGIDKEDLEAKGWDGTTETMITALREIAEERGYDVIAQKITNLSDAITVLEIRIAQDLVGAFKTVEPVLVEVAKDFMLILDAMEWVFDKLKGAWNDLGTELDKTFGVQKVQKATGGLLKIVGVAITLGITFGIVYKVVKALRGVLSSVFSIFGKGTDEIAKTTGDIAKTGGTVAKDSGGGFKENFKTQWSKLGKDLGKMARAFFVVAVGMVMAFALVEEGIVLISGIGATYDALKPQFESGINFIKEFGLWFALLGGAMLGLSYAIGQIPQGVEKAVTKGATRLAYGMAIAMGLIAEAIVLLIAPMTAIALLGGTASFLGTNLDKGLEVITWIGNALHQIDMPVAIFIGGFLAISLLLGLVQPLTLALAVGIASALALVTEAIGLLVLPLGAIALLGGTASMLGEENIQQGAEAIRMIGRVLKVLSEAMVDLFVVDIATLGVMLTEKASQLITGKTGLQALTDDIIPSLTDFIKRFNGLEMGEPVDQAKVQAVIQMTNDLPPLFNAVQNLNNAMGTTNVIGNIGGALGGSISGAMGMGLKGKLDQLYNDVKDVMDFATKLGGLSSTGGANASAVTQTANAITQLKAKLTLLVSTISGASAKVKTASKTLGTGLKTGFTEGSSGFNTSVVSILAKGISEVQSRYNTWHSGGKTSAQKLTDGFKTFGGKIKSTIDTEMGYALDKLDEYKDDFYSKGQALGKQLSDGFESSGGLNVGSPANIARAIAQELKYSMDALNIGEQMMYKGGVALGRALTNGYGNSGNLRTNVGVLASKGVNNEQLQANAKNVQVNAKKNQQTPQSLNPTINIDMSNSTVIGVQDLDTKIRQAVEKAIVSIHTSDGAIGY